MYIEAAVPDLVATLYAASSQHTQVYVAHGRNRQAEGTFLGCCKGYFDVSAVDGDCLDAVYRTGDVDVLQLQKL